MRCSSALVAAAVFASAALVRAQADVPPPLHASRYAMGTVFDVLAYHTPRDAGAAAIVRALDEVVRLDRIMSDYRPDSDLAALVRDGRHGYVRVDPDLYDVLRIAADVSARSDGRFDVTVAPVVKLWRRARDEGRPPAAASLAAARACVGHDLIELAPPDRVRLRSACADVDLGAIGKGYAVDRALAILRAAGVERALVNAGGSSIGALGAPEGRPEGWPVALAGAGRPQLLLKDRALSSSGGTAPEGAHGETVQPREGTPVRPAGPIVVVAPSAAVADALSTMLLVAGPEAGAALLPRFESVSAIWMSAGGAVESTYPGGRTPGPVP